jgi:hypothetical protein
MNLVLVRKGDYFILDVLHIANLRKNRRFRACAAVGRTLSAPAVARPFMFAV